MAISFDASAAMDMYPEMKVAFLLGPAQPAGDGAVSDPSARIATRLKETYGTTAALENHALIEAYRQFYLTMNVRPSTASTPIKQALRVFAKGYRPIHPVVDLCMEVEYSSLCSFQVYDRDRLGRNVSYIKALGSEEVIDRAHGGGSCGLRKGELALVDELGVINSPMCGNEASRVVRDSSQTVLVRIFKIPGHSNEVFDAAVNETAARLGATAHVVLDAQERVAEVEER